MVGLSVIGASSALAGPAFAGSAEKRMVKAINGARSHDGLSQLRKSRSLDRSASAFARYLVRHGQFGHRPSVSVNRNYPHCGEALAMHFSMAADIGGTLRSWLGSPVHRGLVMTTSMNLVGVGHASARLGGKPKTVWVLQVARR
jgi:uncharacterized protein YkwD